MPLDPIDIPDACRIPKECDAPDDSVVDEIRAWIKATGSPHTFRLHTHTKPLPGSLPIYIEEFTLPKKYRAIDRRAPCPCCTDHHPKYWKNGKIAYFPDERVLRLMGPHCFATLDAGGHHAALERMRRERKRKADIRYLVDHIHVLPILNALITEWSPTLEHIDDARATVRRRLELLNLPLWSRVRDGQLHVTRARKVIYRRPDGSEGERTVHDMQVYGSLRGHTFFAPDAKPIDKRLSILRHRLAMRRVPDVNEIVRMDDKTRHEYAQLLNRAMTRMREAYQEAMEVRQAISREAMATLNGWSRDPGSDFPIHMDADQDAIYIGRSADNRMRIPLGWAFWGALKPLPQIAEVDLAAE
ncbi:MULTISPECIES: hypothetical protein [unclassified Bradyrhizobium]|uniref:hypothetical protein n=1 Tax=Bradyrhizobium sp. USDA 4541 TaxID=2817704 RepID=UPI0020A361E8|nr:hypothetical protein [Bradyrhizobium sp. USDA 4541]MCP1854235.1 hypothetical protein [Bradyrhizobium sp. USDA 4541]